MSIEPEKSFGTTFSGLSLTEPASALAETNKDRTSVLEERKAVYEVAASPEWLGAALGAQRRPAGPDRAPTLPRTKDLGEGMPASQLVHRKGGRHD